MPELSDRERDVASGLVRGLSNRQIANQLMISEATVKAHMKGILKKLGVHNRTQAAVICYTQMNGKT